jgi:hypothetical protein
LCIEVSTVVAKSHVEEPIFLALITHAGEASVVKEVIDRIEVGIKAQQATLRLSGNGRQHEDGIVQHGELVVAKIPWAH